MLAEAPREARATAVARVPVRQPRVVARDRVGDHPSSWAEFVEFVNRAGGRVVNSPKRAGRGLKGRYGTQIRLEGRPHLAQVMPHPSESRPVFRSELGGKPGGEIARLPQVVIEGMKAPGLAITNEVCERAWPFGRTDRAIPFGLGFDPPPGGRTQEHRAKPRQPA